MRRLVAEEDTDEQSRVLESGDGLGRVEASDRGAASAEMAGIIFVVSLIVAAVVAAAGSGALGSAYESLFCRAFAWFGTSCEAAPQATTEDREPEEACVVQTDSQNRSLGVTVIVDLGSGGTIIEEAMSDGTYRVTYEGDAKFGVGLGAGGHVTVEVDDEKYGFAADASINADVAATGGSTWVFDSPEEASELVSEVERQLSNVTTPVVGGFRDLYHLAFGEKYEMPSPTETYQTVGAEGSASAEVTGLVEGAEIEANTAHLLGVRENHQTGEATLYYSYSADLSASTQSVNGTGIDSAGAHGESEMTLALTFNPEGEYLTNISAEGMAYGDVNYDLAGMFESNPQDDSGGRLYNASVDLTDEESALIAYDLVRAAGLDLPPSQLVDIPVAGPSDVPLASATERFVDAARERGEVYRQDFTGEGNTGFEMSAGGKFLGEFGGSYSNTSESRTMTDAQYFDGSQWVDWMSCSP